MARLVATIAGCMFLLSCGSSSQTATAPTTSRCGVEAQLQNTTFPGGGGSGTLQVTTNRECTWSAQTAAPWIKLSEPARGQGDGTVAFTVNRNADPPTRTGAITVNDRRLEISQEGTACEIALSSTREAVEASGGDRTLQVTASSPQCTWAATPGVPWIRITSGASGSGNGSVGFHVDALDGPARSGTIQIAGEIVQIDQGAGCTFSIGANAGPVEAAGGLFEVPVAAPPGCTWNAQSNSSWIGVKFGSGSGNGSAQFVASGNTGPARQGRVTVAGKSVDVMQADGCTYAVTPPSQDVPPSGGAGSIAVTTGEGCHWTASEPDDWVTVSPSSGSGTGTVAFTIAPNPTIARSTTIGIAGRSVTVNQASACTFALAPPYLTYDAGGGNGAVLVIVTGPCTWTAKSTVDWIQMISGTSGAGNGLVQFVVLPNPGASRGGVVMIAGQNFQVSQSGH
jgi:hypothetical protein